MKGKIKIKILETTQHEMECAIDEYLGYCINCGEFTNANVEPDARRYECEGCGLRTVYGAEEAMLNGWVVENKEKKDEEKI